MRSSALGLYFPVDIATTNARTALGGPPTRPSGARSVLYGKTMVRQARRWIAGSLSAAHTAEVTAACAAEIRVKRRPAYRVVRRTATEYAAEMKQHFGNLGARPRINLDAFTDPSRPFNLANLTARDTRRDP